MEEDIFSPTYVASGPCNKFFLSLPLKTSTVFLGTVTDFFVFVFYKKIIYILNSKVVKALFGQRNQPVQPKLNQ